MAKKKKTTTKATSKKPKSGARSGEDDLSRAEAVAAGVEIVEVRLHQSWLSRGGDEVPEDLTMRHRSRLEARGERQFDVLVDFVLESHDMNAEVEAGEVSNKVFRITATYLLRYENDKLDEHEDASLQAFAKVNAVYNAWPFWREYVHGVMGKMGMAPATLPVFRIQSEPEEAAQTREE